MILLLGFYTDPDPARGAELVECLRRNLANDRIAQVHVFAEDPDRGDTLASVSLFDHAKIRLIPHGRRVTYRDLFAHANAQLPGRQVVIASADIYFDDTLARLDGVDLTGQLLCLSRWDVRADGSACLFERPDSQDAWVFQTPIREFDCDFHLGRPGCDNRLAWEAERVGLVVSNPSRTIRANHLHLSQVRRYDPARPLEGLMRFVPPVFLEPPRPSAPRGEREPIFALTSLSLSPELVPRTRECIRSWTDAGMKVRAFNHPYEIVTLARLYDVEFVPVAETTLRTFGRHYVPIHAMLDWAAEKGVTAMLINADIYLRMSEWEVQRLRRIAQDGLCYFLRHNHDGSIERAEREPNGIDAFLFHGPDVGSVPRSTLSMGQPYWDYWLPHVFAAWNRPICCVGFPAAFHQNHPFAWSWGNWHRCGIEFARVTGAASPELSFDACRELSLRVRADFARRERAIPQTPVDIRAWIGRTFSGTEPKTFLELGAHRGTDTEWLATVPNVTIHAFEPDPRNTQPPLPNVTLHRAAVADRDGVGTLVLSERGGDGEEWTFSSSIKRPKGHLERYPVTFGRTVNVELVALDTFCQRYGLGVIDFIWADVQGAEGEVIRGARRTLERTRYVFTEYSDDELYEGQITLSEMLRLLPDFRVLELWPEDVLLENRNLRP